MQDKEFDKAFNSKFADFEIEPSPMVWDNISRELDGKKGKRSLIPYLSIAASIIVLVAAGMLFFRPTVNQTKHNTGNNRVAVNVRPSAINNNKSEQVTEPTTNNSESQNVAVVHQTTSVASTSSVINTTSPANINVDEPAKAVEPAKVIEQPVLAAIEEPKQKEIQLTSPGKETDLMPKGMTIDQPKAIDKPILAAVKPETPAAKKRGIHNMGGLINALVAKVDKRDDKLIHFSDDDDDDTGTVLTEVNLGVIKIIKQ